MGNTNLDCCSVGCQSSQERILDDYTMSGGPEMCADFCSMMDSCAYFTIIDGATCSFCSGEPTSTVDDVTTKTFRKLPGDIIFVSLLLSQKKQLQYPTGSIFK